MALPLFCLDRDAVLKDPPADTQWRHTVPDYTAANALFEKYKTTDHQPGSLQAIVQNIVKNWEKEASHKTDPRQWSTIDLNNYQFSCNGQQKHTAHEMVQLGTYNALIGQTNYYDSQAIPFEESHKAFKETLSEGFAWEVLEVFSGPPAVTFTWRHFGRMTHAFSCRGLSGFDYTADPTNKMVELFGMCKATVNDAFQIQDLQVFYDPNQLFAQLTEISPFAPFGMFSKPPSLPKPTMSQTSVPNGNGSSIEGSMKKKKHDAASPTLLDQPHSSKFCSLS